MSQAGDRVELDTSVGYRLKQASSALHAAMDAVLRPLCMSITAYACLELLAHRPGLSNAELARGTFVTRQSMNVVLQALEREGLVARAAVAPSGRALPTELTGAGRDRLAVASAAVRGVEDRMRSLLDPEESAVLGALLARCVDGLAAERPRG
jgi:DNA-binding MarR family transcriptional regulator